MKTCVPLIAAALLFCVSPSIPVSLKASGLVEPPDHCVVGITPQDYMLFLQDPVLEEIFGLTLEQEGKVPLIPQDFYEEKMTSDPRALLINGSRIDCSTIGLAIYRLGVPGDYSYVVQEEESSQKLAPMSGQATSLTWMSISDATYYATYAHRALGELPDGFLKMDPLLKTSYTTFSLGKSGSFSKPQENTEEQQQSIDDHTTWITGLLIGGGLLLGGGAYAGLRVRNPAIHQREESRNSSLNTYRDEETAKTDGVRQVMKSDGDFMSTDLPSQNVILTQDHSCFPVSAVNEREICGLPRISGPKITEKIRYQLSPQGWLVLHPGETSWKKHAFTYEQFKYTTPASSRVRKALPVFVTHFYSNMKLSAMNRWINTLQENSTLSPVLAEVRSDFLKNHEQHIIQAIAYQRGLNKTTINHLENRPNILNSAYDTKVLADVLFIQKFNDSQCSPHKIEREMETLVNVYKHSEAYGLGIQRAWYNSHPNGPNPLEETVPAPNLDMLLHNPDLPAIQFHPIYYRDFTSALKATSQECAKSARNQKLVDICLEGLDFHHKSILAIDNSALFSDPRTLGHFQLNCNLHRVTCFRVAGKAAFLFYQELAREDQRPNILEARRKAYLAASKRVGLCYPQRVTNYCSFRSELNVNEEEMMRLPSYACQLIHQSYTEAANYYAQEHPNEALAAKYCEIGSYFEKALKAFEDRDYEQQSLWLEAGLSAGFLQAMPPLHPLHQQLVQQATIVASDDLHRAENFNTGERTCVESIQRFFNHLRLSFLNSIPPASTRANVLDVIVSIIGLLHLLSRLSYYISH